jgi:hypothetical protein
MFRPISGHPQVHSWSLKHTEEEIYLQPLDSGTKYVDRAMDRWVQSVCYAFILHKKHVKSRHGDC